MRAAILTRTPGAAEDLARELPVEASAWEAPPDVPALCRRLSESPFDVVVAEHALPQISAWEALDAVATAPPHPPVIVLAAIASEELAVEAMRRGAADFVSRQRLDRLRPALSRALAGGSARSSRPPGVAELRAAPVMLWCLDEQGRVADASDQLLERLGWSREELAGRSGSEIVSAAADGSGEERRGDLLRRDGRRIAVRVRCGRGGVHAAVELPGAADDGILCEADVRQLERENLRAALDACEGRVYGARGAAARLGLAPTTLASRLRVMGLRARDGR